MASASATRSGFIVKMKRAIVATCAIILFLAAPAGYAAAQGDAAVRVTGRGETAYEARQDAVRQALQQTVEQLVISQQVVKNDKLVMDRIISTMNGFVSQFAPVRTWTEKGSVLIEADIVVSETRITNFVSLTKIGRTAVNSDNILAAAQAEKLAQKTRGEMLAALFQGFPGRAPLEASPLSIAMNKADPDFLDVETTVRFAPGFISSLRAGLKTLGAKSPMELCRGVPYFDPYYNLSPCRHPPNSVMICFKSHDSHIYHYSRSELDREADCLTLPDVDLRVLGYVPYADERPSPPPDYKGDAESYYDAWTQTAVPYVLLVSGEKPLQFRNRLQAATKYYGFLNNKYSAYETNVLFNLNWHTDPVSGRRDQLDILIRTQKVKVDGKVAVDDIEGVNQIDAVPMLHDGKYELGDDGLPDLLAEDFPIRRITDPDDYKSFINELISGN